ncbi:MAG: hypothetical protein K8F24_06125, partial [Bacteroidales bacterium]|nr:hypothetical protein [Bacteroidales bacterium]
MPRFFSDKKHFVLILILLACCFQIASVKAQDTVFLKKKTSFYINDSLYKTKRDTTIILDPGQRFLPLNKDSIFYQKISKHANSSKLLEELLDLAIRQAPAKSTVQGDLVDDSKRWDEYQGLIISDIIIKQPPIGEFSFADSAL